MKAKENLYNFPCSYPLKVVGKNTNEFHAVVSGIIEKHVPEGTEVRYTTRASSGERFLSLTATFTAHSEEQLAALYRDLTSSSLVIMTL